MPSVAREKPKQRLPQGWETLKPYLRVVELANSQAPQAIGASHT